MSAATITIRMDEEKRRKLETIAKFMDRSRSYLIQQAVDDLIAQYEWQLREIEEGIKDADEGKLIDHDVLLNKWRAKLAHPVD
jgi:predicted transcriptional regulator